MKDDKKEESKRITYFLPIIIIDGVSKTAEKKKMTKSAVVHQAIEDYLNKHSG